ncbi:MAG: hypothetical protein H6713_27180 [Myxococcales bacterium]|nr:hypothetical protein [Myxococcales bacterium]
MLIDAGHDAEARDALERTLAPLDEDVARVSPTAAQLRFELARALAGLGEEGAAVEHALEARRRLRERGAGFARELASVERWLGARGR